MSTKLEKPLEREVRIHGIEEPVLVEISPEGLSVRLKGNRISLTQGWVQVVEALNTPTNVPSFLMGKPYDFLKHTAAKKQSKKSTQTP